jgi:hypothetical protein
VHGDLQATAWAVLGGQHGTVAAVGLRGPDLVLAGQGLGQRPFHDGLQLAELMAVERQPVVRRDTAELGLELRDDTEIGIDDPFRAPDGSAAVQVGRAFAAEHVGQHLQPDPRVDAAVTAPIALVVGVQDHDLVAEKPGGTVRRYVIRVLVGDSSSLSSSRRNAAIFDLICSASCLGPTNPSSQSSAYVE